MSSQREPDADPHSPCVLEDEIAAYALRLRGPVAKRSLPFARRSVVRLGIKPASDR